MPLGLAVTATMPTPWTPLVELVAPLAARLSARLDRRGVEEVVLEEEVGGRHGDAAVRRRRS